jgi:acyl-CoA synthetase (AMP-forming)/AMP-acid ligase II
MIPAEGMPLWAADGLASPQAAGILRTRPSEDSLGRRQWRHPGLLTASPARYTICRVNVARLLSASAVRRPERAVWKYGTAASSYAATANRVSRLAGGLQRSGIGIGDRLVLVMPNGPELFELLWACFWAGIVAVPLNRHLHPREVAFVVEHSQGAALVVSAVTGEAAAHLDPSARVIWSDSSSYLNLAASEAVPVTDVSPDAPAWLFYTSGTTGRPKGATLTHRNLLAMTMNYYSDIDSLSGEAVFLHAAPLTHGSGLYLLPAVGHGATNVISGLDAFDPADYLALVDRHGVTHGAFLAPTMLRRITDKASELSWRSQTLRNVMVGGAALYEQDLADALDTFGPIIGQMYGQGESPMTIAVMPPGQLTGRHDAGSNWRSCGRPFTGVEVRIGEPAQPGVSPGVQGDIFVRGDVVMAGYWDDRQATAEALRSGWLRTGDMGYFDEHGFLYLTDRSKDVIITGGSNVYPREVEEALLIHPGVHEAAVIGVADPVWGESVRAYVVAVPGWQLETEELTAHCREHLASFKKPKSIVFVDELPKSPNGKILKRVLRTRLPS